MRIIIIYSILLIFSASLYAQPPRAGRSMTDERREAIETRKIAYFTKKMDLTTDEAAAFWPIYNAYSREIEELSENTRRKREQKPEVAELSENEAIKFVEDELQRFETAAALRRTYTKKMLEVIPAQKVALLFEAEKSFNRMIFREAQRRHRINGREMH